jgi:hypothetical protein
MQRSKLRSFSVVALMTLTLSATVLADTLTLQNGRVVRGNYLGGSPRQVKMEVADRVDTFDVSDIVRIEFGAQQAAARDDNDAPPRMRRDRDREREPSPILRPDSDSQANTASSRPPIELPSGTNLVVRMIDAVDSETNRVGQTFQASIDEPVLFNGDTVIPRGADVILKLVDQKDSGKLTGRAELTLDLMSVRVDGRMVDINTQTVSQVSSSRGERTAKVAGGTAALGAIIGAIAGGGKGAAIGAGAGAAAGTGAEVMTKGQRVRIPSETRLTFVTDTAVRI